MTRNDLVRLRDSNTRVQNAVMEMPSPEQMIAGLEAFSEDECVSLADILANNATPRDLRCGVYLLFRERRTVYVGQTTNITERLGHHVRGKPYDAYLFIPCELSLLEDLERAFIRALDPPLNTMHKRWN